MSLAGRPVAVITGTTHGIGRVTARELAKSGWRVVMLCRDLAAGTDVARHIETQAPESVAPVIRCDLASLASVRACVNQLRCDYPSISLLINNAGLASARHLKSADGFELTFAANHLGPFLLTSLLLDRIAAGGRIVNVASRAHYRGVMDLEHIDTPAGRYHARSAYARSKLANVMHTLALARRLAHGGIAAPGVTVNCLHPGIVATNLLPRWLRPIQRLTTRVVFDAERGAQTTLYVALSQAVAELSGRYFDEHQQVQKASSLAEDVVQQESLWQASTRWAGL